MYIHNTRLIETLWRNFHDFKPEAILLEESVFVQNAIYQNSTDQSVGKHPKCDKSKFLLFNLVFDYQSSIQNIQNAKDFLLEIEDLQKLPRFPSPRSTFQSVT